MVFDRVYQYSQAYSWQIVIDKSLNFNFNRIILLFVKSNPNKLSVKDVLFQLQSIHNTMLKPDQR